MELNQRAKIIFYIRYALNLFIYFENKKNNVYSHKRMKKKKKTNVVLNLPPTHHPFHLSKTTKKKFYLFILISRGILYIVSGKTKSDVINLVLSRRMLKSEFIYIYIYGTCSNQVY